MDRKPMAEIIVTDVFGDYYKIIFFRQIDWYDAVRKAYDFQVSLEDIGILIHSVIIDINGKVLEV